MIAGLTAALGVAACGKKEAAPPQATPGMGSMAGMTGMQGTGMRSDSLMPMMRAGTCIAQ